MIDLVPVDVPPPPEVLDAASLTDYAVISRYPIALETVEGDEYGEAVRLAKAVVRSAESVVR